LPKVEQLLLDYGRMGLSVADHPLAHLRAELDSRRVNTARALATMAHGTRVRVAGLVTGRQRPVTASGITFMSLEDETGIVNLVVVLPVFERHRHTLLHARILYAEGRLEREGEVVHVKVDDAEPLAMAGGRPIAVRSRDFH
jgi:error-prone DNA polymerase